MRARALWVCVALLLGSCARTIPPPAQPPAPPPPANARAAGVSTGPEIAALGIDPAGAERALNAYRSSCPALLVRIDRSGLTTPSDWQVSCNAAATWPAGQALSFFATQFEAVRVADGVAFATGYYEPEIAGSRTRQPGYEHPVYALPPDPALSSLDRTAIEEGALADRGLEIAWAADPVEFFFLQIQGSGRLRLPDGRVMRIGYAGQNGQAYTGIGSLMRQRGLLAPGQASMQGIMAWLRANPAEGKAIMRENRSWVYFRELTGPGPLGALNVPVVARTSVAADPAFIPLGAPVFLALDRTEASGLWVAQDTGGAIKGANRVDTFWGAGDEARLIAGGMSARGSALVLLPKGVRARLLEAGNGRPAP